MDWNPKGAAATRRLHRAAELGPARTVIPVAGVRIAEYAWYPCESKRTSMFSPSLPPLR
jgi:hypothetical protein